VHGVEVSGNGELHAGEYVVGVLLQNEDGHIADCQNASLQIVTMNT
jgi:hypothetical protein